MRCLHSETDREKQTTTVCFSFFLSFFLPRYLSLSLSFCLVGCMYQYSVSETEVSLYVTWCLSVGERSNPYSPIGRDGERFVVEV